MRSILHLAFIMFWGATFAQDLKTYTENTENGFAVYADNAELCPVSVKFDWELVNMKPSTTESFL